MKTELNTAAKRAKLPVSKNPTFTSIGDGVSLGWRQPGRWVAKLVFDGKRFEEKIGVSEEVFGGLSFTSATAAAIEWAATKRRFDPAVGVLTVGTAIEAYIVVQTAIDEELGHAMAQSMRKHVLADRLASIQLDKLDATDIKAWREGRLRSGIKAASVNRYQANLRAALNRTVDEHFKRLPKELRETIRVGCASISISTADKARDVLPLTQGEVKRVIEGAYKVGDDFGRRVMLLAATGARHSQIEKLKVRDVLHGKIDFLYVPGDRKGRAKVARQAQKIAIAPEVRAKLAAALLGRGQDELLLTPIPDSTYQQHWKRAVKNADLPEETIPLVLRHTSIVRALQAGLPAAVVAKLHFTSTSMIEMTYGQHILTGEDLGLRAALRL